MLAYWKSSTPTSKPASAWVGCAEGTDGDRQQEQRQKPRSTCDSFTYSIDEETGTIVLLYMYDKEERKTISADEITELLAQVKKDNGL